MGVGITANNKILGHLTANSNKSTVTVKILKNEQNLHKDRENDVFSHVNGNSTSNITSVVSVIHFSCFV